jgi:hypothetical protein
MLTYDPILQGRKRPMDTPTYVGFINPMLQALREGRGSLTQVEMVDSE